MDMTLRQALIASGIHNASYPPEVYGGESVADSGDGSGGFSAPMGFSMSAPEPEPPAPDPPAPEPDPEPEIDGEPEPFRSFGAPSPSDLDA
jgi:hypothetical protein